MLLNVLCPPFSCSAHRAQRCNRKGWLGLLL
jgi:hypothetical protein